MKLFREIDGYNQIIYENGEITCDCMWSTMELSRKEYKDRIPCKHIKKLRNGTK